MGAFLPTVLTAMMTWAPPTTNRDLARYLSVAQDIEDVAYDPEEEPAIAGPDGRARTALLLAATGFDESFFRADIDEGRVRGDHGHSVCLMQVWVERKTPEGWTADDLIQDREKCIRAALHVVRYSLSSCRHLTGGDRLGVYTHGKCVEQNRLGRGRWLRAFNWPLPIPSYPNVEGIMGALGLHVRTKRHS